MRTFTIGDIHGGYKALKQCLERSKFNYKEDHLIALGDIVDGWPETPEFDGHTSDDVLERLKWL